MAILKSQEQIPAIVVRLKPKYVFCQQNLNIFLALISKFLKKHVASNPWIGAVCIWLPQFLQKQMC